MRIYRLNFIRHGRTEANEKGIYIGTTDYPLSDGGKKELIEKLDAYSYPKVERVYSSPLKRCTQTAEILFPSKEILIVDNLRELDFGDFEGKSVDELINREDYKKWLKGGSDNAPPNGETMQELVLRTYLAITEILQDMMREEIYNAGVISHSGIIVNMLSCFGVPKIKPNEITCNIGEGYEIALTAQLWQQGQAFEIIGQIPFLNEEI